MKLPGKCLYTAKESWHWEAHVKTCTDETIVTSSQITFGDNQLDRKTLDLIIEEKLLPESFRSYRQRFISVFDIETLEEEPTEEKEGLIGIQKVVSVATATNVPGQKDQFFLRNSSLAKDGQELVNRFLDHLFELEQHFYRSLPGEIKGAMEELAWVQFDKFSKLA